jgi:hypothetical protein
MFSFSSISVAQNLEVISLKKGVEVSGSLSLNAIGYKAFGVEQRRDPLAWYLTGGLNLTIFGYEAPFTFNYSNTNSSYTQPFNRFQFAPQYKWIKVYTGNTSMTFSPYTLAGHMFSGLGTELTPGKWRIAAMYGRLKKAVPFSLSDTLQNVNASFKRMGYGLKVAYEHNNNAVGVSVFFAKDDPASIPFIPPNSSLTPQQNVAISINGRKNLFSNFFVDVEYGLSVLNTNTFADNELPDTVYHEKNLLQELLPENTTNRYFDAVATGVGYQGKHYTIQLKYERISPEYQTLGAYYFNNDMRNITVVTNTRLFGNKLTLGSNIGVQQNNLDHMRTSTGKRIVAAFNAQAALMPNLNASANYSNFASYTKVRPPSDPFFREGLDTLNFYQVSETINGSISYTLGEKDVKQAISFSGSFQKGSNTTSGTAPPQISDFLNGSLSYGYALTPVNLTMSLAITASTNNMPGATTSFFGPAVNTSKSFFNKALKASWSSSYSQTAVTGATSSPMWSNQLSFSYVPLNKETKGATKSNFALNTNVLRRLKSTESQPSFTELTITAAYSYVF